MAIQREVDRTMAIRAFVAGGAAVAAGDWDEAVAKLDTGLQLARACDPRWVSFAVGQRAYLDAHRGHIDAARRRIDALRECGTPPQFQLDFPGLARLAALEAEGAGHAAVVLARELWAAAPFRSEAWMLMLALDVARIALVGRDQQLLDRVAEGVAAVGATWTCLATPMVALTRGMAGADRAEVALAVESFTAAGALMAAAYASEEYACLAAAADDRAAAVVAREHTYAAYDRAGAAVDRARLLSRLRTLGVRRGPRSRHRTAATGWAALTPTERRVADLVRTGRTNPEIAAQLFVSPRTVQTHVSHILAKLGVRSRGEVARITPEPRPARSRETVMAPPPARRMSRTALVPSFWAWKMSSSYSASCLGSFVAQRLAANGVAWSATIAVAMTLVALIYAWQRKGPKILNMGSLVLFAVIAIVGFVGGPAVDLWLYVWGRPLVGVILGLFILVTVPVMPFTEEYARQSVPREHWNSPGFRRINRVLSAAWGVAILIIGLASVVVAALDALPDSFADHHALDLVLNWVLPIVVIAGIIRFTRRYPERTTGGADAAAEAPGSAESGTHPGIA